MKKSVKNISVFVCICAVITILLAVTNSVTAPIIEQNQNASANAALLEVMPDGEGFEAVDISSLTLPATVSEVYNETSGKGNVVKLVTSGYGSDMVIMCGVSSDGVVTGAVCLSSNETLSKEKTYGESFKDKDSAGVDAVDIISGATKTTEAYKNAVKDALNTAIIVGGGSVDIRSDEEILQDNLKTALPEGENFTNVFLVEDISCADAIYEADNQAGYVFVVGEQFIGVSYDGTVLTEGIENADELTAAVTILQSTVFEDVDFSAFEELTYVLSAKKTASGNFVVETRGAGYGIKGGDEYHPASNEYIVVRVAISEDGRILDCITVSEAETDGLGDACADEEFYGQFDGKTESDYTEIDAISGATLTTNGYIQAIERAFTAVNTMKGGN